MRNGIFKFVQINMKYLLYVPKSSILLAGTGVWKISSVACGFSYIKIDYSDNPKSLISRINKFYAFLNKISLSFSQWLYNCIKSKEEGKY